jgi:pyruvate dehydrogenase E1 component beta subunit
MPAMTMIEAIRAELDDALARDDRVMIIGEDVGTLGGVFRATDGLQKKYGEQRVVDMPLAEGAIVGSAIGLAISGMRPVAEIQFLGFAHQAFHQIGQQLARLRFRSQGRCELPVVVRAAFGGGVRSPELHSDAFEALYVHVPGLKVVTPATPADAKGLLRRAIEDPDPVLFLEPLRGYRAQRQDLPDVPYEIPFGELRVAREGDDVTIVAWSAAVELAERAADALAEVGVSAQVVDLRTLAPFDVHGLTEAVKRTGRCVIVHEAPMTGGFGAEIAATLAETAFYYLKAPIERVTAPDTPYPLAGVERFYIPSVDEIVATVRRALEAD